MESKKTYLTKEGYEKILQRKNQLEDELRKAKQRVGESAGPEGLWHENAAFEQAESDISMLVRLIGEIEDQVATAEIVESRGPQENVAIGSTVRVKMGGVEKALTVLGEGESDPVNGKISYTSPIGKALLEAKRGDSVEATTPGGKILIEILEVT